MKTSFQKEVNCLKSFQICLHSVSKVFKHKSLSLLRCSISTWVKRCPALLNNGMSLSGTITSRRFRDGISFISGVLFSASSLELMECLRREYTCLTVAPEFSVDEQRVICDEKLEIRRIAPTMVQPWRNILILHLWAVVSVGGGDIQDIMLLKNSARPPYGGVALL